MNRPLHLSYKKIEFNNCHPLGEISSDKISIIDIV